MQSGNGRLRKSFAELRGSEVTVYDVRKFRKDPSQDVRLRPGDKIEVRRAFLATRKYSRRPPAVRESRSEFNKAFLDLCLCPGRETEHERWL